MHKVIGPLLFFAAALVAVKGQGEASSKYIKYERIIYLFQCIKNGNFVVTIPVLYVSNSFLGK